MNFAKKMWDNWATAEELSNKWNVTPRRVRQIFDELRAAGLKVESAVIVQGNLNPYSKPCYRIDVTKLEVGEIE